MVDRLRLRGESKHQNTAIKSLATGDWIRKDLPLCLIGGSVTDNSHLLIGLGAAAAEKGSTVKNFLATRLVGELVEAKTRRS